MSITKNLSCFLILIATTICVSFFPVFANNFRYGSSLDEATQSIQAQVQKDAIQQRGVAAINTFILKVASNIFIPLVILIGIFLSIIGFYKLMTSESEEETQKGTNYIVWGIVGIVTMISAKYVAGVLRGDILKQGVIASLSTIQIVQKVYTSMVYPFLKMALYIGMGVLFILLLIHVFKYFTSGEGENTKATFTILLTNVIGLLVIMGAKQVVEAVYGKQQEVLNGNATMLGDIGKGILADKHIPILYQVIQWIMGLTGFILLAILLFLAFKMLTSPYEDGTMDAIKKNILYVGIGILVIGACYLIVNFLIVT